MPNNSFSRFVCLLGATFIAAATSPAAAPTEQLEMSYELKQSIFSLHEPVVLLFKVHNGLEQPVALDLGVNWVQFFEFTLTSPEGKVIQGRAQPSEGLSTQAGKLVIEPRAQYRRELLLNQWFDLDSPGKYILSARVTTAIDVGEVSTPAPQAQLLPLDIKPRDINRLTGVCVELAKQVEIATTVDAAQFPARALSYVDDPIAVPYLARVLSAHTLAYEKAVQGLERIGNDEAVEVLLSALNENYGDIAELATWSLGRMQDRITNPRLKETVRKAVERSSARARNEFIKQQIAYLDYRSPGLQRTAIQTLMGVQDGLQQAEPTLQRLANDPNQPADVRAAAQDALKRLHPNN